MPFPREIVNDEGARIGVVHLAADSRWHANDRRGPVGSFETEAEAVAMVLAAPPTRRQKRLLQEKSEFVPDWTGLTDPASGFPVRNARGLAIGGVMPAGNKLDAWHRGMPLGRFDTPAEAVRVIRLAESNRRKKPRPPPTFRIRRP